MDCSNKLKRAEMLISGLGGEKTRWTQIAKDLRETYNTLTGNILCYCLSITIDYLSDWAKVSENNLKLQVTFWLPLASSRTSDPLQHISEMNRFVLYIMLELVCPLMNKGVVTILIIYFVSSKVKKWAHACHDCGIVCTLDFSIIKSLGEAVTIQQWNIDGLPSDDFSVESAIIIM